MTQDPRITIPNMMPQVKITTQQLVNKLMQIEQYLQGLDQSILNMSVGLTTAIAHIEMLQGILVDKEVCTVEELKGLYKEEVEKPVGEYVQELTNRRQRAVAAVQQQVQEVEQQPEPQTPEEKAQAAGVVLPPDMSENLSEETKDNSDVVLPSEKHTVTKYK